MQHLSRFLDWLSAQHPGYAPMEEVWKQDKANALAGSFTDRYANDSGRPDLDFDRLREVIEKWMGGSDPNMGDPAVRIKIQQKTDHSIRVAATAYRAALKAGWNKGKASKHAVLIALHDLRERGQMPDSVAMHILAEFGFGKKEFDFLNHFTMTQKTTGADDTEEVFSHAQHAIGDHSDLKDNAKLRYILGKMSDRLDNLSKRVQLQWMRKPLENRPKSKQHFRKFAKLDKDGPKYLAVSMDMLEMLAKAWRQLGGNRKTIRYVWDNLEQWVWGPLGKRYPELLAIRDDPSVRAQVRAGQADLLADYREDPTVQAQVQKQLARKQARTAAPGGTYPDTGGGVQSRLDAPTIPAPDAGAGEPRPAMEWFRY